MKKHKIVMLMCALLVVSIITTGCGKEVEIKNGSKVAVSLKDDKFSATEYYNKIKESNISTLVDMIDESILNKMYKDKDTKEEDEAVQKQIDQIKSYYGENEDTYKSVIKQYFGVDSEKELETKLRLEYKRNQAVKEYITKNLKDSEIKKYYEDNITGDVKASHILISINAKDDATEEKKEKAEKKAEKTAKKVIEELNNGKDFAKLAKKYSNDDATKSNGGDLGYFQPSDMTEAFAEAVKNLNIKEYTKEPVKTEYGYHIILKTGEKEKAKLKDVKSTIKEKLTTKKMEESSTIYYETLMAIREENKIKWNDSTLKKAYNNYMDELIKNASSNNNSNN